MSAWCVGASAETVWPLSLVFIHAPLSEHTTPRGTASVTRTGRRTSPRSFHTRTRIPSCSPRVRASSGWISSGGVSALAVHPPNVDVVRRSDAGVMRISGYEEVNGRYEGSRAPNFFSRYDEASSTLPDGVVGSTLAKRLAGAPANVISRAAFSGIRLGGSPPRRG